MPNASALSLGPGRLYVADLPLASEPATLYTAFSGTGAPAAPWAEIGYTEEGSTVAFGSESDGVPVAEETFDLFTKVTGQSGTVSFSMAENTVRNLTLAFNGGTVTATGTTPNRVIAYEPPAPGTEKRKALLFVSEDFTEAWLFRQVFQTGNVSMDRRKGADKTLIPVEFAVEKPSGKAPFKALYAESRLGGLTVV